MTALFVTKLLQEWLRRCVGLKVLIDLGGCMRVMVLLAAATTFVVSTLFGGCAINNALGLAPSDLDLQNDGSDVAQSKLVQQSEVVYERGSIRRPGADPLLIAAELHVASIDDVSAAAWSDDAYNYLSNSDEAAAVLEHPAVGFDQFAHSSTGEAVLLGSGLGLGMVGGAIAWFVPTKVTDGINRKEQGELQLAVGGGIFAGVVLGIISSAAYTYIVPAMSTPFATPIYRKAARAFNEELEQRVVAAGPQGDAPAPHVHDAPLVSQPEASSPPQAPSEPAPVEVPVPASAP